KIAALRRDGDRGCQKLASRHGVRPIVAAGDRLTVAVHPTRTLMMDLPLDDATGLRRFLPGYMEGAQGDALHRVRKPRALHSSDQRRRGLARWPSAGWYRRHGCRRTAQLAPACAEDVRHAHC